MGLTTEHLIDSYVGRDRSARPLMPPHGSAGCPVTASGSLCPMADEAHPPSGFVVLGRDVRVGTGGLVGMGRSALPPEARERFPPLLTGTKQETAVANSPLVSPLARADDSPECPARRDRGTRWFLAGYTGVAGFFVVEALTRARGRAASLDASADDQGTTRGIVTACVAAATLAPLLRHLPVRSLPRGSAPVGLALQAAGLALRVWSMRTLGLAYSRTLRTDDAPEVVDAGPYHFIRHPGYAGSLLTWTGFALTSRSLPVIGMVAGLLGRAYQQRIAAEEAMLGRDVPGYAAYSRRTRRLVPFVW